LAGKCIPVDFFRDSVYPVIIIDRRDIKKKYSIMLETFFKITEKLPSWSWVLVGFGGIALVIGGFIGLIWAFSHIEGFASIIFLVIGYFAFGAAARSVGKRKNIILAGAIIFYSLMGAAIDQTGNFVYNMPVNLMCPESTSLERNVQTLHPLPGRTDFIQDFTCYDGNQKPVYRVENYKIALLRLGEYIVLGYILYGFRKLQIFLLLYFRNRGEKNIHTISP
jgi:hypothetical protein